jgi:hypothetical protein
MTSTNPAPILLPGVPAVTWSRLATIAAYLTIPVYFGAAYLRIFETNNDLSSRWFAPIAIYGGLTFAATLILGVLSATRSKRETVAGYTTQWRSGPTLPQLDGHTGVLIRRAGDAYVKKSDWREHAFAGGAVPMPAASLSPWATTRPNPWAGLLGVIPALLIATVAFSNLMAITGPQSESYVQRLVTALIIVVVALAVILGIGATVTAGRLRRLAAVAPGELDFVFAKSKGYSDGYISLALAQPTRSGYLARGVSANAYGLTVWEGNPFEKALKLPWAIVTSVQVDTVQGRNQSNNMVLVNFRTANDELASLPLAYPKINAFPLPSKAGVRWIAAQLNELRDGELVPRVL